MGYQQYAKFVKMALETNWRGDVAALTYIETRCAEPYLKRMRV